MQLSPLLVSLMALRGNAPEEPRNTSLLDTSLYRLAPQIPRELLSRLPSYTHHEADADSIWYVKLEGEFSYISLIALEDVSLSGSSTVMVPGEWLAGGALLHSASAKLSFLCLHPIIRGFLPIVTAFIYASPDGRHSAPETSYRDFRAAIEQALAAALPQMQNDAETALARESWLHLLAFVKGSGGLGHDPVLAPFVLAYLKSVAARLLNDATAIYGDELFGALTPIHLVKAKGSVLLFPTENDIDALWEIPSFGQAFASMPSAKGLLKDHVVLPRLLKALRASKLQNIRFNPIGFIRGQLERGQGNYSSRLIKIIVSCAKFIQRTKNQPLISRVFTAFWDAIRFPHTLGPQEWSKIPAAVLLRDLYRAEVFSFFQPRYMSSWAHGEHSALDYSVSHCMWMLHLLMGSGSSPYYQDAVARVLGLFGPVEAHYRTLLMADLYLWIRDERLDTLSSSLLKRQHQDLARELNESLNTVVRMETPGCGEEGGASFTALQIHTLIRESGPLALRLWLSWREEFNRHGRDTRLPLQLDFLKGIVSNPDTLVVLLLHFESSLSKAQAQELLWPQPRRDGRILEVPEPNAEQICRNLRSMHFILNLFFARRQRVFSSDEQALEVIRIFLKAQDITELTSSSEDLFQAITHLKYLFNRIPYPKSSRMGAAVSNWNGRLGSLRNSWRRHSLGRPMSSLESQQILTKMAELWQDGLQASRLDESIEFDLESTPSLDGDDDDEGEEEEEEEQGENENRHGE